MSLNEQHCANGAPQLEASQALALLAEVPGYAIDAAGGTISKEYAFADFYETIAFVNALAYIVNQQDHHPELAVSYKKCKVSFSTHDANGLTRNDFICAAKVNALIR